METFTNESAATEPGTHPSELHDYAAASRQQAEYAEARGNLALARELNARAKEADELERQRH